MARVFTPKTPLLTQRGFLFVCVSAPPITDARVAALSDADILVAMRERTPITAALLARRPCLRLLITSGMRHAAIHVAAAKAQGVIVCGTDSHPEPAVEITWALILGLMRHLVPEANALRSDGPWQQTVGRDLHGARLGLLGVGKIGQRVAQIGQAFGMQVSAGRPNLDAPRAAAVQWATSQEALFAGSEVVSLHRVLGERSPAIVDADTLACMPAHACLINTARAGRIDQQALIDALTDKRIAGAGLDVFDIEPLPAGHPLRTLPNVLATPPLGYVTARNYRDYFGQGVETIAAWLQGAPKRVLD
ncbi:D-2-hydroxyacid dehydrogenase family protein [Stenotrophomonas sp. TWI377]|uniref:D-2-hydroxyacid dehydrogenase family protein n=1 Tax=Stenotrophomonas sp. TWI377 TaxID=3136775 RepID=UPI00320795FB